MKHINLTEFLELPFKQQVAHFNEVISKEQSLNWETALINAIKNRKEEDLNNFGGLKPFLRTIFDKGMVVENQEAEGREVVEASEMVKILGLSASVASKFKGMKAKDLIQMSVEEIAAIKGVGEKSAKIIFEKMPKVPAESVNEEGNTGDENK